MYRSVEKIVTEYIFTVGSFEFRVKGRIQEKLGSNLNNPLPYSWTVSHHYRASRDAPNVTMPQKTDCVTREEAERLLFTYVRGFTEFAEPNKFYRSPRPTSSYRTSLCFCVCSRCRSAKHR